MKKNSANATHFGLTFIATGEETNGKYFLSQTTVPVGDQGPPIHFHSNEDEGFYLLSGALTFVVNSEESVLKAGQFLNIEKGEKHTWRNDSNQPAILLVTFTPAGIENMFRELQADTSDIAGIGKKYGTEFLI